MAPPRGTRRADERRLLAGTRCHNRFYRMLAADANAARRTGALSSRLTRVLGAGAPPSSGNPFADLSLHFEVNLGRRRPDCVGLFRAGDAAGVQGVCVVVELKTCRYSGNMNTDSKRAQRASGLGQLRDSVALLRTASPVGVEAVSIAPVLVFVSQRGLGVLRVTRLPPQVVRTDVTRLRALIGSLAEYTPITRPRAPRKKEGAREPTRRRPAAFPPPLPPPPAEASPPPAADPLGAIAGLFGGSDAPRGAVRLP
ncbi:nuclear protein UL24 [Beluga whale alphaherpesvirus 1]|uniref:Protein UL24 homolog n=1 Tax=Beluga whale alphaherpesvirus 1 TaxID=1434720 RepID=A0A286MM57_9ALPH|nr:nuclear protein UL24 [Beluga whale alphaherpesvirus 1]ASW27083.1 nuclear protein UL24 [Beluga whale alphaherpesvirus 1]